MYKPEYGDPICAVRMPGWMRRGLDLLARQQGTTLSEILRGLAAEELKRNGITEMAAKPLPGQRSMFDK